MIVPLAPRAASSVNRDSGALRKRFQIPSSRSMQDAHGQLDGREQQELDPHAGERMRVAVVLGVGAAGDRILFHAERARQSRDHHRHPSAPDC